MFSYTFIQSRTKTKKRGPNKLLPFKTTRSSLNFCQYIQTYVERSKIKKKKKNLKTLYSNWCFVYCILCGGCT